MAARLKELVGARVPAPADLPVDLRDADLITQSLAVKGDRGAAAPEAPSAIDGGAMPIYRHPADRNTAATGVEVGRRLDLSA